ncbi:MAG: TIGR00268 family protein, partial [Planctomycetaceae bacterium]|nr:TIGR00268 family protein [Planctomycetaceae bacterium]
NLSVWNKPAEPCLSTRVPYHQPLTESLLRRIGAAESFLKEYGFSPLRVRVQGETVVRIEVPVDQIGRLWEPLVREKLIEKFQSLEFRTISVDLQGFRSGSMNEMRNEK